MRVRLLLSRHHGVDSLKAKIGVAAKLTVEERGAGKHPPRFAPYDADKPRPCVKTVGPLQTPDEINAPSWPSRDFLLRGREQV